MKKHLINEFKIFKHDLLLEFAQITDKNDFFYQKHGKIKVYGGGGEGNTREHNPPHFHLDLNNGSEIQVIIPNNINGELQTINGELNTKIIKELRKWFEMPFKTDNTKNNYDALREYWNTLNDGDDNVDQI